MVALLLRPTASHSSDQMSRNRSIDARQPLVAVLGAAGPLPIVGLRKRGGPWRGLGGGRRPLSPAPREPPGLFHALLHGEEIAHLSVGARQAREHLRVTGPEPLSF